MLIEELRRRELPPLFTMNDGRPCTVICGERRAEILDILQRNTYGYMFSPEK